MSKRFLDYDPLSGITQWFDYDEATDKATIYSEQDVGDLLDHNKALANSGEYRAEGRRSGWNHLASIPHIIIEKWRNEKGVDVYNKDHMPKVLSLLDDPEYRYLKTTTARHVRRG